MRPQSMDFEPQFRLLQCAHCTCLESIAAYCNHLNCGECYSILQSPAVSLGAADAIVFAPREYALASFRPSRGYFQS